MHYEVTVFLVKFSRETSSQIIIIKITDDILSVFFDE